MRRLTYNARSSARNCLAARYIHSVNAETLHSGHDARRRMQLNLPSRMSCCCVSRDALRQAVINEEHVAGATGKAFKSFTAIVLG